MTYRNHKLIFTDHCIKRVQGLDIMNDSMKEVMEQTAQLLCEHNGGDMLVIGYGMGFVDKEIRRLGCKSHTMIECHGQIYEKMLEDGWDKKDIMFMLWQDAIPLLKGRSFDAIYFDTGDRSHSRFLPHLKKLLRPGGVFCCWFPWNILDVLKEQGYTVKEVKSTFKLGEYDYYIPLAFKPLH